MYSLLSFVGILVGILIAKYTKEELKQGKVKLKDMNSGKEQLMSADELVLFLQKAK